LAWLIRAAHHTAELEAIGAVRGSRTLTTRLLLTDALAEQCHARGYRFVWIVLTDDCKLSAVCLISKLWLIFVLSTIDVIVNWIFDSSKTKAAVQDSSAIFLVALAEARILM